MPHLFNVQFYVSKTTSNNYKNAFPVFHEIKHEISDLVSRGFTNEKIAKRLDISEPTVKTHLRNIYSKTDIHDRTSLAIRVLNSDKTQVSFPSLRFPLIQIEQV